MYNNEVDTMPLTWFERLDSLELKKGLPLTEAGQKQTVLITISRNRHKLGDKKFSIRTNKETGERAVWRIK